MIDWTIKISSVDKIVYYAVDANDYSLIKTYEEEYNDSFMSDMMTSISIRFTHPLNKFIFPRIGI